MVALVPSNAPPHRHARGQHKTLMNLLFIVRTAAWNQVQSIWYTVWDHITTLFDTGTHDTAVCVQQGLFFPPFFFNSTNGRRKLCSITQHDTLTSRGLSYAPSKKRSAAAAPCTMLSSIGQSTTVKLQHTHVQNSNQEHTTTAFHTLCKYLDKKTCMSSLTSTSEPVSPSFRRKPACPRAAAPSSP